MTNKEFDTQFDIFYNNIASNAAPSVDPYEKSVFLTQAQRDIIIELYNGRGVPGISFESTEEARRYLSNLVNRHTFTLDDNEGVILLPKELWFLLYEECIFDDNNSPECFRDKPVLVYPIRLDDKHSVLNNPFRGTSERRILREDVEGGVILHSKYKIKEYRITYMENPDPIILEDLTPYDLTIEDKSLESESNVNPILHRAILERAVQLAKQAYTK